MSLTILEQIADVIHSRLLVMIANPAYLSIVTAVVRPARLEELTPQDGEIRFTYGATTRMPELDCCGNPIGIAHQQQFNLHCHILNDENDLTPIEELSDRFKSQVIRAITFPSAWWHMDGLALYSEFGDAEPIAADGGIDGFNLPLLVVYRVSELSPYVSRL
jgi:hypothetical protein